MRRSPFFVQLKALVWGFCVLTLAACGGNNADRAAASQTGVFIDSPVDGLMYQTASVSGVTKDGGHYTFKPDETLNYVALGCGSASGPNLATGVPAQTLLTPYTLGLTDRAATNVARLLLSVDEDGNSANGLDLAALDCENVPANINFDVPAAEFGKTGPLKAFIEKNITTANGELVSANDARAHVDNSVADYKNGCTADGVAGCSPTLSIGNATVLEGNDGTRDLIFELTLTNAAADIIVTYSTADYVPADANPPRPATSGTDYTATTGSLTLGPGNPSGSITVKVNGDATLEPDEILLVNIATSASGVTLARSQAIGTIRNDDTAPTTPTLSIGDASATEGSNLSFTVSLSPANSTQTVTVNFAGTPQTASATDYSVTTASPLSFAPNETSKTIVVAAVDDSLNEDSETFRITLSGNTNAALGNAIGTGTILDNDGTPQISVNDISVNEGNSSETDASFTVSLTPASGKSVTVKYQTEDGTATAPGDYTAATLTTLTFNPGETSKPVIIKVKGDTTPEANETFKLDLSAVVNATIADPQGVATITNDDSAPPPQQNSLLETLLGLVLGLLGQENPATEENCLEYGSQVNPAGAEQFCGAIFGVPAPPQSNEECRAAAAGTPFEGDQADAFCDAMFGVDEPSPGQQHASCASGDNLARGGHYQQTLVSASGEVISFEVFEPKSGIRCANGAGALGAHPLILQGHGFGGARNKGDNDFANYRNLGYAVISIDQRGFGQSSGTVRVMDPDFEAKDLVQILDWAEANLDYLAYRDEGKNDKPFVARPQGGTSEAGGINLIAGAIGSSYGGGYQFLLHNVDTKDRLDALAPDITWHDLRYSLNPGDTLKSAFGLLLVAGGERGSYQPGLENQEDPTHRGIDPYIKEVLARAVATGEFPREALEWFRYHSPSYWCGLRDEPVRPYPAADWGAADPNRMLGTQRGDVPGSNRRDDQGPISILISQGLRDNLFNFNEAWWNYQCARVRGGEAADVRLITHQGGHILNPASLISSSIPSGTPLDVQSPPGDGDCGVLDRGTATVQWFNEKLLGQAASSALSPTNGNKLCLSLADNDSIYIPEQNLLAPVAPQFQTLLSGPAAVAYYQIGGVGAASVPQGVLAQSLYHAGQLSPSVVPLVSAAEANGLIVAGIPQATFRVKTPAGVNDAACAAGANLPSLRTGCDSIIFVGLGLKKAGSDAWVLIDDQVTPVRGLGEHSIELVGVGERMQSQDQLALLVYGYHPQYLASYSRGLSILFVNV